ncbi:MAG: hypothetical protein IIW40_05405 [Clostridia bacterium]|nr:hypothetical protein [Clostridia bacterium]
MKRKRTARLGCCIALCLCLLVAGCGRAGDVSDVGSSMESADADAAQHSTAAVSASTTGGTSTSATKSSTTALRQTTATTSKRTTAATTSSPAASLYFPVTSGGPGNQQPPACTLHTVTVRFPSVSRMVRLSLPQDVTVKNAEEDGTSYVQLYRKDRRIGRLVPDGSPADFDAATAEEIASFEHVDVEQRRYAVGDKAAVTYAATVYTEYNFYCILEMEADSIRPTDFIACAKDMRSHTLLTRDNRLQLQDKPSLRIAIAGNSFVGTSKVGEQLQAILRQNGKQAEVSVHCYGNYRISKFVYNKEFLSMLQQQAYDVLFMCGVYTTDDALLLPIIEHECEKVGTLPVIFPAHNESDANVRIAYEGTKMKLADWKSCIKDLLHRGIPEKDLIIYDNVKHSKELAGYAGAVMLYGMLYETAPRAARIGAEYSAVTAAVAQKTEDLVMEYIQVCYE